jgi:DNA-binding GntR family transcriptional regulator
MAKILKNSERAHDYIRQKIMLGELAEGARVSDVTVAEEMGLSRTPVREAINRLHSEGLLEQIPHAGAFVRKLSRRELGDLFDVRTLLESHAAEQASTRITEEDLVELDWLCNDLHRIVRQFRDSGDATLDAQSNQQFAMDDIKFHMIILRACGNQQVAKIVGDFRIMTSLVGKKRPHPTKTRLNLLATTWLMHSRVLRALRARSPEVASRWMSVHLQQGKEAALAHFDQKQLLDNAKDEFQPSSVQTLLEQMERYQPVELS